MCQYISGLISDTDLDDIRIADPISHFGTRERLGLPSDWGREWEWTCDDDGASLTVRVDPECPAMIDGEEVTESAYRTAILSRWPRRIDLERSLMTSADAGVRRGVAHRIAPEHLLEMRRDTDASVRWCVAYRIAPEHLPEMMADVDSGVRWHVSRRISPEHLPDMMRDTDAFVRNHVADRIAREA